MGKRCFVPYCKSGYDKQPEKVSVFGVPAEKVSQWQSQIHRQDRRLTSKAYVCEKHFQPQYIIREVATKEYSYSLAFPRLAEDAIPTIFPNCPKSKKVKQRRKKRRNIEPETNRNKRRLETDAVPTEKLPQGEFDQSTKRNRVETTTTAQEEQIANTRHPTTYSAIQETSGHFEEVQIKDEPMAADSNDCRLYQQLLNTIKTEPDNSETEKNIHSNLFDKEHFLNVKKEYSDSSENQISVNDDIVKTEQIPMFESVFVKEQPFDEDL